MARMKTRFLMAKTVHVYPLKRKWVVKREGRHASQVYPTQKEAIEHARCLARDLAPSQMVVHGQNGMIREHVTHGLPRVQNPPGKGKAAQKRIEKAVGRVVLERITSDDRAHRA